MFFLSTFYPSTEATPTLADMERYVRGEMKAEEAEAFAASLADDPMLADALEGLRYVEDPQALRRRLKQLRQLNRRRLMARQGMEQRAEERSKRQSRTRPLYVPQLLMAAAAVVLLLFLGVNLYRSFQPPETEQAMATEGMPLVEEASPSASSLPPVPPSASDSAEETLPAPSSSAPLASAELVPPTSSAKARARVEQRRAAQSYPPPLSQRAVPLETTPDSAKALPRPSREALATRERPSIDHQEVRTRISKLTEDTDDDELPELYDQEPTAPSSMPMDRNQRASGVPVDATPNRTLMAVARALYQRQDWEELRRTLQRVLDANPVQGEALYLMGDSYYRQGKVKEAISYLMQVLPDQQPAFDQAQWTLAFCALAQGKEEAALRIVRGLAQREGRYQTAAQSLLQQWPGERP